MKAGECTKCLLTGKIYARGLCPICYRKEAWEKKKAPPTKDPPAQKDFCTGKPASHEVLYTSLDKFLGTDKIPNEAEATTDAPLTKTTVTIRVVYTDNQVELFESGTVPRVADHGTLLFVDTEGQVQNIRLLVIKRWVWKKVNGG